MAILGAFIVPHPPIILPQIGKGKEKDIQNTINGFNQISDIIAKLQPETIVLVSPHSIMYSNYIHISPGKEASGNLEQFGVYDYNINVKYDDIFVEALGTLAKNTGISAGTLGEKNPALDHGTIVPLDFINKKYQNYKLVRIGLSGLGSLEHYKFGKLITAASILLNRKIVFIASGDLSHKLKIEGPYGFSYEGPAFDKQVTDAMISGDFLKFLTFDESFCEKAAECGLRTFQIMAGALDEISVKSKLLSYEGPFGVGYGIASFEIFGKSTNRKFDNILENIEKNKLEKTKETEDEYVRLARLSLETYIKTNNFAQISENLPKEMLESKAGVFVSIKKHGQLRGCIGTISPVESSIAKEIFKNAISAGCRDPRFEPIKMDELESLVYSVDVLGKTEPIDSKDKLDVKKYGVIVTNGDKRGLLLPNLDGVDNIDDQISIAKQKAGINPNEPFYLERFEVIRHK
ncbi:MAG: AmmeMemoRadiSam system protein A [Fusobacteriaceae bacterium]|jgi:AmmeMemoRadiSam system protein A|nr:AmmeMemoRadiSam system protein A [Fusobacteriaceae bacterium]